MEGGHKGRTSGTVPLGRPEKVYEHKNDRYEGDVRLQRRIRYNATCCQSDIIIVKLFLILEAVTKIEGFERKTRTEFDGPSAPYFRRAPARAKKAPRTGEEQLTQQPRQDQEEDQLEASVND